MSIASRTLLSSRSLLVLVSIVAACADGQGKRSSSIPPPSASPAPALATDETPPPASGSPTTEAVLRLEPFAEGLASPTFITHAGDGSGLLYVVEQEGRIRTVDPEGAVAEVPFLDMSERVVAGGEQGLLGLAFHPDYPDDDRFYVMYTAAADGANTISELRATGGVADPDSERVLLAIPDFAVNHNGGMVAFGPDGYLYAGTGDGGGGGDPQGNGQDPFALLGKILRIDVDGQPDGERPYAIPADNPFADGALAAPEVWAIGMRNPWRFTFDRETGDLWIADVGQGQWEEVDAEPAGLGGRNYGWSIMEGPACFEADSCDQTGLTLPVTAYEHGQGDCTVVGGYVYRGEAYPEMQGRYVYGDYCSGRFWGLDAAMAISGGSAEPVDLLQAGILLSSFGEDEDGELYAVDLGGAIHRLVADRA
ncbi:MAG: PQQ-dependent sugar dehydrogenase [Chloroflexi bacterium]|nr:PQQ-dependent sugar dehydrogenase [Chloroflexota bacterium]